jgi:hypothetical protein
MKKNVLIAAAIFGALGFAGAASANVASHAFTWSGSVPAVSTQNGWVVKAPQGGDIASGILVFNADAAGKGVLTGSTDLMFNVFDYTGGNVGAAAASYEYQMTSLGVSNNGLVQEQGANGYFEVHADGSALTKGTSVSKAAGGETTLMVAPSAVATPSNQPNAGDDVNVQAAIVVISAA